MKHPNQRDDLTPNHHQKRMNHQNQSKTEGRGAVACTSVVSRSHPWKQNWKALKQARAEYRRRMKKKRRDDEIEYFRETEKAWHRTHPNGANTGNPKFTERAKKANAAKSANDRTELSARVTPTAHNNHKI